uniref:EF-hand domain-containing protein n=1 Tax=Alexandrium monilatum TaxID=311494 RepID=A0A7S4RBP0_9DINO|mmetsp:Transcript_92057/g.274731  ORF Transcript_92057/g.274731 Transcript_92057/m.274731 type:complete len:202 (-) Transcript_92057:11-616(-)
MEMPGSQRSQSKQPFSGACTKCGSKFISNAKFCCECGEKQPEPTRLDRGGFHFFKGTEQSLAAGLQPEVNITQKEFQEVVCFAKKHHLPVDGIRKKQVEFLSLDVNKDGTLSVDEFAHAVRRYCNIPDRQEVPTHLLDEAWFRVDGDATGCVNFETFLIWSCRVGCTEEMLVADPNERYLRELARNNGLLLTDVDDLKKAF